MIFLILISCKNKAMSASYLQQKFMSSSRFLSLFLRSFGSFSILFSRAKLGECVVLWFASWTPPPLKWLTEQKNPFEVCKHAARYSTNLAVSCCFAYLNPLFFWSLLSPFNCLSSLIFEGPPTTSVLRLVQRLEIISLTRPAHLQKDVPYFSQTLEWPLNPYGTYSKSL